MNPDRIQLLELDIDLRMHALWQEASTIAEHHGWDDHEALGALLRASYGKGYMDALEDKGTLCDEHGYHNPAKGTRNADS